MVLTNIMKRLLQQYFFLLFISCTTFVSYGENDSAKIDLLREKLMNWGGLHKEDIQSFSLDSLATPFQPIGNDSDAACLERLIDELPIYKSEDESWQRKMDTLIKYLGQEYAHLKQEAYYSTWQEKPKRFIDSLLLLEGIRHDSLINLLNLVPIKYWPENAFEKFKSCGYPGTAICLIHNDKNVRIDSGIQADMLIMTETGGESGKTYTYSLRIDSTIISIESGVILLNPYFKKKLGDIIESIKNYRVEISGRCIAMDGWDYTFVYKSVSDKKSYTIETNSSGSYETKCILHQEIERLFCEIKGGQCDKLVAWFNKYGGCKDIYTRAKKKYEEKYGILK